jgi:hypothetical protein
MKSWKAVFFSLTVLLLLSCDDGSVGNNQVKITIQNHNDLFEYAIVDIEQPTIFNSFNSKQFFSNLPRYYANYSSLAIGKKKLTTSLTFTGEKKNTALALFYKNEIVYIKQLEESHNNITIPNLNFYSETNTILSSHINIIDAGLSVTAVDSIKNASLIINTSDLVIKDLVLDNVFINFNNRITNSAITNGKFLNCYLVNANSPIQLDGRFELVNSTIANCINSSFIFNTTSTSDVFIENNIFRNLQSCFTGKLIGSFKFNYVENVTDFIKSTQDSEFSISNSLFNDVEYVLTSIGGSTTINNTIFYDFEHLFKITAQQFNISKAHIESDKVKQFIHIDYRFQNDGGNIDSIFFDQTNFVLDGTGIHFIYYQNSVPTMTDITNSYVDFSISDPFDKIKDKHLTNLDATGVVTIRNSLDHLLNFSLIEN